MHHKLSAEYFSHQTARAKDHISINNLEHEFVKHLPKTKYLLV